MKRELYPMMVVAEQRARTVLRMFLKRNATSSTTPAKATSVASGRSWESDRSIAANIEELPRTPAPKKPRRGGAVTRTAPSPEARSHRRGAERKARAPAR